jgi:NADH dehydrogenase [ubiquinone] 1 alpha subcomplex assembly factor 5
VIHCGTLDSVDDLPGALLLAYRALRPGGRLVASMVGGPSLSSFKAGLMAAEAALGHPSGAHFHPQLEIRAIGDLLTRAGFVMPVVDGDFVPVRYAKAEKLASDLRAIALGNQLSSRVHLAKSVWRDFLSAHDGLEDGFTLINLGAWKAAQGEHFPVGPSGRAFPMAQ